jgi:predicted MFS family arabinose efflux permease
MGAGAVWTYARNLLVDAGADSSVSVLAWIALGLGGAIVIFTARWTDRLSPRSAWTMAAVVASFAISVFALLPTQPVVVIVSCVVFGWSYIVCCGDLILWTTQIDAARAPAGTAVLFIVLILGQAVGAGIAGSISVAAGYLAAFLVAAVLTLAAAFVVYLKK